MLSVALLGVGSLRCSPSVIASLANLRMDLDVRLYDTNQEFLDIYRQLADMCLGVGWSPNLVSTHRVLEDALDGCHVAVLQHPVEIPAGTDLTILDLQCNGWTGELWPPEPDGELQRARPHQLLRWIRGEEPVWGFVDEHRASPLAQWFEEHYPVGAR